MNYNVTFLLVRQQDQKAFKKLFDSMYKDLVNYANSYLFDQYTSEDLVQEVFIYLWENSTKINLQSSLKSYLYVTVRNRCMNHLKKIKISDKAMVLDTISSLTSYEVFESHNEEERLRLQIKIQEVVDKLPIRMKQIVKLKFIDNYKYHEIAEELNISVNTVKTQLKRAKLKITETFILLLILIITTR